MKTSGKRVFVKFFRKYLTLKNKAKEAMAQGDVHAYMYHLMEAQEAKSIASRTIRV